MASKQIEKAMEGLVVLIADSNAYTRRLTRMMLTNLGCKATYESSDGLVDGAVGYRGDEDVPVILTQRFATRCTAHRGEMHDARVRNHRRYGRIGVFGFELIAGVAFPKFNYRFALHRRPPEMLTCVMA